MGALNYAVCGTRPDLAAALSSVNQYCVNPGQQHWTAVKRIMRYIRGTESLGIMFTGTDKRAVELRGYADADWGGNTDRKSLSGYLFMIGDSLISWASKRQSVTALSSTEAEYVAAACAAQEAMWLRQLLEDVGFQQPKATVILEDNQGCIAMTKNPKFHGRTKHIDIKQHFIRDLVEDGHIELKYCPTDRMLADMLTKPVAKASFEKMRSGMNISTLQE